MDLIVSGALPSGEWVSGKEVTEKLRVSRSPFREAMGALAKEGLIDFKSYRGFSVRSFSRKEVEDLYELYKRLECFSVELAVPQMSDSDIARLEHTVAELATALRCGDMKTYAVHDLEFFAIIADRSGNAALTETRTRRQVQLCGTIANESSEFAERAQHGREDIVHAFKARDVPRVVFLTRGLIGHVQTAVLARL